MGQQAKPVSSDLKGIEKRRLRYILRELSKPGAFLFAFKDMSRAAVFIRGTLKPVVSVTSKEMWALLTSGAIECFRPDARSVRYRLASDGRATLARLQGLSAPPSEASSFAVAKAIRVRRDFPNKSGRIERKTVNLGESPLGWLSRRSGADGKRLLEPHHVEAGEKLRADFERGQLGPHVTQNWTALLAPVDTGTPGPGRDLPASAAEARRRVREALSSLGPDLSDAAFRVCCFGIGMEILERDQGWPARSGKAILKIALERLAVFYRLAPHKEAGRMTAPACAARDRPARDSAPVQAAAC